MTRRFLAASFLLLGSPLPASPLFVGEDPECAIDECSTNEDCSPDVCQPVSCDIFVEFNRDVCMPDTWAADDEEEIIQSPPPGMPLVPGTGSGGGGGGGGGGGLQSSTESQGPIEPEAKVLAGSFTGSLAHAFLPLSQGGTEALFDDLPELDGLLAVRALEGTSLCYHLEATNNQEEDAVFFVSLRAPTLIEAEDPYAIQSYLRSRFIDDSGDGIVHLQKLQQTIDAATAEDVVSFIGFSSGTDLAPPLDNPLPGEETFHRGPFAGPAPSNGPFTQVGFFTSFTLSPGDTLVLQGAVQIDENEGGILCSVPAIRVPAGSIFLDGFNGGGTSSWSQTIPVPFGPVP